MTKKKTAKKESTRFEHVFKFKVRRVAFMTKTQ